jgi:hypothetical protein
VLAAFVMVLAVDHAAELRNSGGLPDPPEDTGELGGRDEAVHYRKL